MNEILSSGLKMIKELNAIFPEPGYPASTSGAKEIRMPEITLKCKSDLGMT